MGAEEGFVFWSWAIILTIIGALAASGVALTRAVTSELRAEKQRETDISTLSVDNPDHLRSIHARFVAFARDQNFPLYAKRMQQRAEASLDYALNRKRSDDPIPEALCLLVALGAPRPSVSTIIRSTKTRHDTGSRYSRSQYSYRPGDAVWTVSLLNALDAKESVDEVATDLFELPLASRRVPSSSTNTGRAPEWTHEAWNLAKLYVQIIVLALRDHHNLALGASAATLTRLTQLQDLHCSWDTYGGDETFSDTIDCGPLRGLAAATLRAAC
jgi:hypothetical protein